MKRGFLIVFVFMALLSVSYASGPGIDEMKTDINGVELPKNPTESVAMVYIVRPNKVGFLVQLEVYLDEVKPECLVGSTKGGQYIYFEASPGTHVIISKVKEKLTEYKFVAEGNKIYFLEQTFNNGLFGYGSELAIDNEIEGRYFVKNLKQGQLAE